MTIGITILKRLLKKSQRAENLNTALKDYTWGEIQYALAELLREEVIAVSNKRFWIRNRELAMRIINGSIGRH